MFSRLRDIILAPLAKACLLLWGPHPYRPERNVLEFCIFVVIVLGNARTALGRQALPNSLRHTPDLFGQLTAVCFVLGALISSIGICYRDKDIWLTIYQFGLTLLGFGLLCYGFAVVNVSTWDNAAVTVSIIWGFSVGSGARYAQVWWFQRTRKRQATSAGVP